ncbi:unnamed protein product [Hydatigera taeniaeformis]|uniref:Ig-like domain-containing protein n=1 Tax=Hydatigena taeniaeformis TaxID=6205 RepID=A0A0R3X0Q0_HYDTA|nr:unnamed protein product [Hydatigera taeniaeformis]
MPQNLAVTTSVRSQSSFVFTLSLVMTSFKGPPSFRMFIHFLLLLLLHTTSTHGSTEFWHYDVPFFIPPDPSRPCRHAFRDDPETSALLADFVVIGHPTPTYRHTPGVLYNASVLVEQVLKRPRLSIYPVREGFPILTGPFSQWTDLGRCWINVHSARKYIFFIDRPNWAGFFRISHLPLFYTTQKWQKIQTILKHPPSPLQMRSLHHQESLKVQQGQEVVLSCVVMGRPAPLISWYVNNTQQLGLWNVATGRGVIHKNKRKSRLQISNTQPIDSGNYSCLAENVNGYIKKTVEIYGKVVAVLFRDHKQLHNPGQHCRLSQVGPVAPHCFYPPRPDLPLLLPPLQTWDLLLFLSFPLNFRSSSVLSLLPSWILQSHRRQTFVQVRTDTICRCRRGYVGRRCELASQQFACLHMLHPSKRFQSPVALWMPNVLLSSSLAVSPNTMEQDVNLSRRYQRKQKPFNLNALPALEPIPLNCYAPSDRSPESLSRVCTPLGHPNCYINTPATFPWREDIHCANIATIVSTPTTVESRRLLTSALPFCTGAIGENRHLPQLTS